MGMTRREFSLIAGSILLGTSSSRAAPAAAPAVSLVLAPSNLGLRPENGKQPGTWQAPRVLMEAGLRDALEAHEVLCLERPLYEFEAQPRTRIRNGRTIRAFSLRAGRESAGHPRGRPLPGRDRRRLQRAARQPAWARLAGGRGLVHVDGHSDFTQEKSYATPQTLGAAAGMDLALASGRGEPLLTEWPGVEGPLAVDADIVQVGERGADERMVQGVLRRHPLDRDHAAQRAGRARRRHRRGCRARARAARSPRTRPRLAPRGSRRAGREGHAGRRFARQSRLRLRAARRPRRPRSPRAAASPASTSRSTTPSAIPATPMPRPRRLHRRQRAPARRPPGGTYRMNRNAVLATSSALLLFLGEIPMAKAAEATLPRDRGARRPVRRQGLRFPHGRVARAPPHPAAAHRAAPGPSSRGIAANGRSWAGAATSRNTASSGRPA